MESHRVIEIYQALESRGVLIHIDGGWGVDALLEKETRKHSDLDIVVEQDQLDAALKLLKQSGYTEYFVKDSTPWNFVYSREEERIDFHVVRFDSNGKGIYGPVERGVFYPAYAFGSRGTINGHVVRCISPRYQLESHSGYVLRKKDLQDIDLLSKKIKLEYPFVRF